MYNPKSTLVVFSSMHRFLLLVSLCVSCFVGQSFAQSPSETTLDKALLWRIDGPALPAPSYLFGTIHIIDAKHFLLSDSLIKVLNRVDRAYLEVDPEEMFSPATQMQLLFSAFMKGDTSLRDLLSPEEYDRVESHFNELGLPFAFLNKVKPMFLSMMVGQDGGDLRAMMEGDGGDSKMKSYEIEISKILEASDKSVGGLETAKSQIKLFDAIPYKVQAQMLLAAVDASKDSTEIDELEELANIYISGDIEKMYQMVASPDGEYAGLEQTLLTNRNRNWIAPMITHMAQGPSLFAVGAGHLGGPEGVIRLLMAEGYTLSPVSLR